MLSQFTLILWGTGPSVLNPSSSDFPRPSNNSCKTFDAQQICIGEKHRSHLGGTGSFVFALAYSHCYKTGSLSALLGFQPEQKCECCEYTLLIVAMCHISLNQSAERMEEQRGRIKCMHAGGVAEEPRLPHWKEFSAFRRFYHYRALQS